MGLLACLDDWDDNEKSGGGSGRVRLPQDGKDRGGMYVRYSEYSLSCETIFWGLWDQFLLYFAYG